MYNLGVTYVYIYIYIFLLISCKLINRRPWVALENKLKGTPKFYDGSVETISLPLVQFYREFYAYSFGDRISLKINCEGLFLADCHGLVYTINNS
jgi:hypothetical protein